MARLGCKWFPLCQLHYISWIKGCWPIAIVYCSYRHCQFIKATEAVGEGENRWKRLGESFKGRHPCLFSGGGPQRLHYRDTRCHYTTCWHRWKGRGPHRGTGVQYEEKTFLKLIKVPFVASTKLHLIRFWPVFLQPHNTIMNFWYCCLSQSIAIDIHGNCCWGHEHSLISGSQSGGSTTPGDRQPPLLVTSLGSARRNRVRRWEWFTKVLNYFSWPTFLLFVP